MKILAIAAGTLLLISGAANAENFFSDTIIGGGFASNQVDGKTFNGYTIYAQAPVVESLKDYLFTDFRVSSTSNESYSVDKNSNFQSNTENLTRYQAAAGLGMPFKVSDSIQLKPYITAGWSWDRVKDQPINSSMKDSDNSFVAAAGLKGEFGKHFMTGVGYSKEVSGLKTGEFMVDMGYKF